MPKTVLGVLGISKKVKGAAKRVPLQLYILLRVGVLERGEVLKRGVVQKRNYINISNIRIINIRTLYLFNRRSSQITSKS